MYNDKTVTVKIRRIDLCNLILATTCLRINNPESKKWERLHDVLDEQLNAFDKAHEDEIGR